MKKVLIFIIAGCLFLLVSCKDITTTATTHPISTLPQTSTILTTLTTQAPTSTVLTTIPTTEPTTTTTELSELERIVSQLENPYRIALFMTENPMTSMAINFEMPDATEGYVEYALDGETDFTRIKAIDKTRNIGRRVVYLFGATLSDLTPGATYMYRVTNTDSSVMSPLYQFTMPVPDREDFTFLFLSDAQENWDYGYRIYAYNVVSVMEHTQRDFDFVMFPGDMINDADTRSQWDSFLKYSSVFSYAKPMAATAGNHDGAGFFKERIQSMEYDGYLHLPTNGPTYGPFTELEGDLRLEDYDQGKTYSFDYGSVHFVIINTEMFCDGTTTCPVYDVANGEILKTWLHHDLENNTLPWTIVMLHRGPYSLSYDTYRVREQLVPIFEEYGVDLVLAGHDHQYSRAIYWEGQMVDFSGHDDYHLGSLAISEEPESPHFNQYPQGTGVTYLTGNTTATKFYGGQRSSGISVHYRYIDPQSVISYVNVSEERIEVVSYVVRTADAILYEVIDVEVLETFEIYRD